VTGRRVYALDITSEAQAALAKVRDKKLRAEIGSVITGLARQPEAQGKALEEPLDGLRSVRAARARYRILYLVDEDEAAVHVVFLGPRRPGEATDVYAIAKALGRELRRS
jgi:mRNA-degrading endonuclease RelE of RelBE toxin-antitoxin system